MNRSEQLRKIGASPLTFCPDLPRIAQRWEAWWRFESDRPLLRVGVAADKTIRWDKGFDLFDRPTEWVALRRRQVEKTRRFGEELPSARVDIGPVAVAAFLGVTVHLGHKEQTTWQDPIIEDWARPPSFRIDAANAWFRRVVALHAALAEDAAGDYLVCFPDMSGGIDGLSNMRGPDRLCMDLYEHREPVKAAAMEVAEATSVAFDAFCEAVLSRGAGITQWLGCWSDSPYVVATSDFNALISEKDFVEMCMPSLRHQARRAGRCIFHLDGPSAARHAETLARDEAITAIQYVPGMGTPSAVAKLPMLRKVQEAGKPLILACLSAEVEKLCGELDPRGLALMPWDVDSTKKADKLMRIVGA